MDILKTLEKSKRKYFCIKDNRIRCSLTGHELPPSTDALLAYANGKKFQRAVASSASLASEPSPDVEKYLVDAAQVESPVVGEPQRRRLFCQLTCRFLADTPADVRRHAAGRRFRTALAAYRAARLAGRPFEPNTSLYRKYRARMSLEGLSGGGGGDGGGVVSSGAGDGNGEEEVEDATESASEGEAEMEDAEDEVMEDEEDAEEEEPQYQAVAAAAPMRKRKSGTVGVNPDRKASPKKQRK